MKAICWTTVGLLLALGCAAAQEQTFSYEYEPQARTDAQSKAAQELEYKLQTLIVQSRMIGPEAIALGGAIKNAPYSADEVTQFSQTLADGTRIQRENKVSVWRDGEGRVRRESPTEITIADPVAGVSYVLDPKTMTGKKMNVSIVTHASGGVGGAVGYRVSVSHVEEGSADDKAKLKLKAEQEVAVAQMKADDASANKQLFVLEGPQRLAVRRESAKIGSSSAPLETQSIEGVLTEGTRSAETIPAGAIGNDRPIQVSSERWYSPELKTLVLSRRSDPRSGDETFRLTNIRRGEPSPDLFQVPAGYQIAGK